MRGSMLGGLGRLSRLLGLLSSRCRRVGVFGALFPGKDKRIDLDRTRVIEIERDSRRGVIS